VSSPFRPYLSLSILLPLAILALPATLPAQEVFTYKAESHLIDTTVRVRDAQGGLVQGLTADDFRILEDGTPQTIRFFAHENDLPLSIGLLIDASGSQEKFVKAHEHDIAVFLREVLEPRDEAFAVCFGNHLRLVSDSTASSQSIADSIARFDKGDYDFSELGPKQDRDLGTALYDAIYFGITEKLTGRQGRRKVLLILSDGQENSSEHDLIDAIQAAQNSNVLIFAVRYTEHKPNKLDARDRYGIRTLDHLTDQTGGRAYDVQTTHVEQAFAEIAGEIRSLYDVAYQSTNHVRDGRFRNVEVLPTHPGLVFRSRAGYYAGKSGSPQP
jgi:Ca-activated chloride channel family protein